MIVNSDKSPLQLAIMFNAKHLNWSTNDYMEAYLEGGIHGYKQLQDFMKAYRSRLQSSSSRESIRRRTSRKEF